ncbi:putative oxidoreductase GLYR1 homolog [Ischnura elegans]|uniref:putative oxidoreductase GLYR1 homolog n=1 Tax=Ischnura elegans TaxID=197161 RepID=UPI001ED88D32|nr:putative oxidoreductase GLYR1 homolog [Ischnura elegans]
MDESFKIGDLVWAKMKGFSPWPGRVASPTKDLKRPVSKKSRLHWIFFFGTNNYAWIEEVNIKPYAEYKDQFIKTNKSVPFKDAVEAMESYIKNRGESCNDADDPDAEFNRLRESVSEQKKDTKPKIRKDHPPKPVAKRTNSESSTGPPTPNKRERSNSLDGGQLSGLNSLSTSGIANHSPPRKRVVSSLLDRPTSVARPERPPLDVERISKTLQEKKIHPSSLKFGFLGLGIMGSGMVKNLLNSGHSVIVWNRTPEKCKDFVKAGAEKGMTPSDVVQMADITFSCVADPQAAKDMVFGNCGVLLEASSSKGYVEMTGIDAETSQDIAEAIQGKGGRYLEAQVQGSKTEAEEGNLVILAAGDRTLFDDCQSCFEAMGKSSFFLGEVGSATKMNLVLQLMSGVTLAGLAEGMALADRAGLQQKDILEVLELTSLACPFIHEKGKCIIEGGFQCHLPLQHLQKDLKLSLCMGDQLEQPLPLTAATNEVFKHAKRQGYGDHDASSVYIRARF